MGIQIYDQISIARKLSNVKLHRAFFLEFALKQVQIAQNIAKFGVHTCISNEHPNLWSNFNYEKLVRSETPLFIFARVALEGVQIAHTIEKVGLHVLISNGHPNLWSNLNSKNLVKSETPSCGFAKVGFKGGENSSERWESYSARLSIKWGSKSMIKFQFREIG